MTLDINKMDYDYTSYGHVYYSEIMNNISQLRGLVKPENLANFDQYLIAAATPEYLDFASEIEKQTESLAQTKSEIEKQAGQEVIEEVVAPVEEDIIIPKSVSQDEEEITIPMNISQEEEITIPMQVAQATPEEDEEEITIPQMIESFKEDVNIPESEIEKWISMIDGAQEDLEQIQGRSR